MVRALLLLLLTAFAGPAFGQDDLTQEIYASVEGIIRREYDVTMQMFARRGTGQPNFEAARQNIKVMFHNRAVLFASCVGEAERGRSLQVRRVPAEYNLILTSCVDDKFADLNKFINLRSYALVFFPDRVDSCREASRLRDLETLYPPYDFLDLPESLLYDFRRLNECLMRSSESTAPAANRFAGAAMAPAPKTTSADFWTLALGTVPQPIGHRSRK